MKVMLPNDKSTKAHDINTVRFKIGDKYSKQFADKTKPEGDIIHLCKLNKTEVHSRAVSTSSATSFCSCSNGVKSTVSSTEPEPVLPTKTPSNKDVSLGCQTNLGKEITVELAVYHGDTKVVSENFEFPNSAVTDKTVLSGKAFEIYCEIVNEEMLQVWGVEKNSDENKPDSQLNSTEFRQSIHHARKEHRMEKERLWNSINWDTGDAKLQALIYWAKSQTEKCKSAILEKYDEIWKMLDRVTVEALDELLVKETELMQLIEEVAELEIEVTDYDTLTNTKSA